MGSVIDTITDAVDDVVDVVADVIDTVVDVVEEAVDIVVDIIETIVDIVVDVIESIVDAIAGLLGLEDQIVEQFEVKNVALYNNPDDNRLKRIVYDSIMKGEDITHNVLVDAMFNAKLSLKKFAAHIDDGNYFEGFPQITANVIYVDYDEVTAAINTVTGVPCTIEKAHLGTLFVGPWIKHWLQENKGYDRITGRLTYGGVSYYVNIPASTYNIATDDYSLSFSGNDHTVTVNDVFYTSTDTTTVTPGAIDITPTTPLQSATGSNSTSSVAFTVVPTYKVPSKPTGQHYVVEYHKDSVIGTSYSFVYKVGTGTYATLDDPTLVFDASTTEAMEILPAIPLRVDNVNFNATVTTKATQIRETVDKLGLDADEMISAVMEDVGSAGISDPENKVDHVFLTFGVQIWGTSQIELLYLFRFCGVLHTNQAVTQATYNASPVTDEKPYNNIVSTSTDYRAVFKWAYITYVHYTVAEVNANSALHTIYHDDPSKFDSNGLLKNTYYVSSGTAKYAVGYIADTSAEVSQYLAGTLAQQSTFVADASDLIQVTSRINWAPVIKEQDGSVSSDTALKPSLVYKNKSGILQKILRVGENVTSSQEMRYYQCVVNGMNVYTLKAPISMLRVTDAATGKFKFVKFNIANTEDLLIPLSYDLVKTYPHAKLSQLFLDSAHMSIYVAHYEVIEIPFWAKLVAVVILVIAVIYFYLTYDAEGTSAIFALIQTLVVYYAISQLVLLIAKEFSPELAAILIIAVAIMMYNPEMAFEAYMQLFGTALDLISNVYMQEVEFKLEDLASESAAKNLAYEDAIANIMGNDIYASLMKSKDGHALAVIDTEIRAEITPWDPETYFNLQNSRYEASGIMLDPANLYDNAFNFDLLSNVATDITQV